MLEEDVTRVMIIKGDKVQLALLPKTDTPFQHIEGRASAIYLQTILVYRILQVLLQALILKKAQTS
jgi:hypothetical protein